MDLEVKEAWDWANYTHVNSGHSRAFLRAVKLLRGAQTHLLDGDNSIWRRQLDTFLNSCGCESESSDSASPVTTEKP